MPLAGRFCFVWILLLCTVLATVLNARGEGSQDFILLKPNDCVPLDKKVVLQLPNKWRKYAGFVKICGLKRKKADTANVSLISIWVNDYYATLPPNAPSEECPLPLIVDKTYRQIGQLPELYPTDPPRELDVRYGKWNSGMPMEIRIHVYNPAVTGNYDYAPLIWNKSQRLYQMKKSGKEKIYGDRPR